MKKILLILALLSPTLFAEVYKIPFASSGNCIELSVVNKLMDNLIDVSVAAVDCPSWIKFNGATKIIERINPGEESLVEFTFSIEKEAQIEKEMQLNFKITNSAGEVWSKNINIIVAKPDVYELFQNYPNPFNPVTTISFTIPQDNAETTLKVFDVLGKEVALLDCGIKQEGFYKYDWNAGSYASGMYIFVLHTKAQGQENIFRKKMLLLK